MLDLASYPGPEKGPGIRMRRHPTFLWGIGNYSDLVRVSLLKHAGRYILVENDGDQFRENCVWTSRVVYALSKVGNLKFQELKNEQLLLHCEDPTLTTCTYMRWSPSLSVNATRNIGLRRFSMFCFRAVNELVACFASSSERQKRQRYPTARGGRIFS